VGRPRTKFPPCHLGPRSSRCGRRRKGRFFAYGNHGARSGPVLPGHCRGPGNGPHTDTGGSPFSACIPCKYHSTQKVKKSIPRRRRCSLAANRLPFADFLARLPIMGIRSKHFRLPVPKVITIQIPHSKWSLTLYWPSSSMALNQAFFGKNRKANAPKCGPDNALDRALDAIMELPVPEMPEARHVIGSCHWGGVKPRTAAQAKISPAA
jgi:hypothetical protein